MRSLWKVVLALLVVLPLGAFAVGALVASSVNQPEPRETVILENVGGRSPSPTQSRTPSRSPSAKPTDGVTRGADPARSRTPTPPSGRGGGVPVVVHDPDDIGDRSDDAGRYDDEDRVGGVDREGEVVD